MNKHRIRHRRSMSTLDESAGAGLPAGGGRPRLDEPLIDERAIERLRELDPGGQLGVLPRVLGAYRSSLGRHLDEMAAALAGNDKVRLLRTLHTLKSSSAAVGALAFSTHCSDIEDECRGLVGALPAARVEALIHEGRAVLAAVEAMLAP